MELEGQEKSLKAQMRKADKMNARKVLILGEDELARGRATLKDMAQGGQEEVALADLAGRLGVKGAEPACKRDS